MLSAGKARGDRYKVPGAGTAGATVYRGLEGFGASARTYHARSHSFSKDAPIMVSVIDTEDQIQKLIPHLDLMITGGLVASSKVTVIRYSQLKQEAR
jgi:PII-like signaling protein